MTPFFCRNGPKETANAHTCLGQRWVDSALINFRVFFIRMIGSTIEVKMVLNSKIIFNPRVWHSLLAFQCQTLIQAIIGKVQFILILILVAS